ncbi:MAG: hypothetical protein PHS44_06520 [Candidatus Dojkabacteria bacterium]|jgi:hypothetical protein|nr:hypothetical protein [Candidatus Dojkabacteria bacterium]
MEQVRVALRYINPGTYSLNVPDSVEFGERTPSDIDARMLQHIDTFSNIFVNGRYFWGLQRTYDLLVRPTELSTSEYLYIFYTHLTCCKVIFGDEEVRLQFDALSKLFLEHQESVPSHWQAIINFEITFSRFDTSLRPQRQSFLSEMQAAQTLLEDIQLGDNPKMNLCILIAQGRCACALSEFFPSGWPDLFKVGLSKLTQARELNRYKSDFHRVWVRLRLKKAYGKAEGPIERMKLNTLTGILSEYKDAFVSIANTTLHRAPLKVARPAYVWLKNR